MGTRSHTYFVDGETPFVCLYAQYDGYPSGHGKELATFLAGKGVTNGLNGVKFNGIEDLAVRTIVALKGGDADKAGGFYLLPPTQPDDEEYGYFVSIRDDAIHVVVTDSSVRAFAGTPEELLAFISVPSST